VHAILTDLAFFDVTDDGLLLRELAPGVTLDEIERTTAARWKPAPDLRTMTF
jgi:3-oxoacid CoA-transferase subunit B